MLLQITYVQYFLFIRVCPHSVSASFQGQADVWLWFPWCRQWASDISVMCPWPMASKKEKFCSLVLWPFCNMQVHSIFWYFTKSFTTKYLLFLVLWWKKFTSTFFFSFYHRISDLDDSLEASSPNTLTYQARNRFSQEGEIQSPKLVNIDSRIHMVHIL